MPDQSVISRESCERALGIWVHWDSLMNDPNAYCLQSQKRLFLGLRGHGRGGLGHGLGHGLGSSGRNRLGFGSLREVGGLELGRAHGLGRGVGNFGGHWSVEAAGADVVLSFAGVLVGILLHQAGGAGGVLVGNLLDLVCLSVDKLLYLGDLLIDDLAVVDIDQRGEIGDADTNQSQAPNRDDFDEPVRQESGDESL